ncbi:MAG: hypothetical protein COB20_04340 [SAR86 cluster bacterium]|uniref:Uncharacterized protein n=1 Tax=SAR86 cluster bacterium TaxID=2030880 RepID=A0A2A4XAY6_9GAMM|nr:MAG: hypothetical protein COB20_04340 [SAR86 cluster bacterium]
MSFRYVFLFLFSCFFFGEDVSAKQLDAYSVCPSIQGPMDRLACFDSYSDQGLSSRDIRDELVLASLEPVSLIASAAADSQAAKVRGSNWVLPTLLTSDGPNHIRIAGPLDNSELEDDKHLEISLAIKYPLFRENLRNLKNKVSKEKRGLVPDNLFFTYRGEYDFYALGGSRYDSSPIVSRNQVPGFVFEWELDEKSHHSIRFGVFHQSNGQSLNNKPSNLDERFSLSADVPTMPTDCELLLTGEEFATYNIGRKRYEAELCRSGSKDFSLAQVSRAYNYWQLKYRYSNTEKIHTENLFRFQIELRTYDDTHDEIFWDPNNPSQIEDYDGLRLSVDKAVKPFGAIPLLLRAELKAGTSSFDALGNVGGKVSVGSDKLGFGTSLFYFSGFGKEPSTYHKRTKYWGLEFELR